MLSATDDARVRAYAVCCLVVLALSGASRLLPSPYAPRVHVRWADSVGAPERATLEQQLMLRHGAQRETTTWSYDLADPSADGVRRLLAHPAVVDTHYIDRDRGVVAADAPHGTTYVDAGPLTALRASPVPGWAAVFSGWSLIVSGAWLLSNRWSKAVPDART